MNYHRYDVIGYWLHAREQLILQGSVSTPCVSVLHREFVTSDDGGMIIYIYRE